MMKSKILVSAACAALFAGLAQAQGGGDLATELQRVVDGMASPDPITRIVTMDDAMNSQRVIVRRKAIELGLTSSDSDLRSMALTQVFRNQSTFNIQLIPNQGAPDYFYEHVAGNIDLNISNFDPDTGNFLAHSTLGSFSDVNGRRVFNVMPGNVSGPRVLAAFPMSFGSGTCNLTAHLSAPEPRLKGVLRCDARTSNEVSIDLLN